MTTPNPTRETGVELIRQERQRQIEKEGWTAEHDDTHSKGELSRAACCYAMLHREPFIKRPDGFTVPKDWPWDSLSWKPVDFGIRDLVKAGAIIAAEIDRLQRLASKGGTRGK